jgi:lipopolysaccharide/colanic/teichoic acid biosynthesis glycosyltransferase
MIEVAMKRFPLPNIHTVDTHYAPAQGQEIHSESEFDKLLERTRAQAAQTGGVFSLICFDTTAASASDTAWRDAVRMAASHLRATDAMGWLDKERIGFFLYNGSALGARRFAQKIFGAGPLNDTYKIETYHAKSHKTPDPLRNFDADGPAASSSLPLEPLFGKPIPGWKRACDIAGSLVALIALSPVFLITAAMIKIMSPGPVFFRQERVGYLGRPFTLWKFRTMRVNHDASRHRNYLHELMQNGQPMTKNENDAQIIPFGKALRASGIDELPQLFNVLRGEMSLIGPRPPIPYEVEGYQNWFYARFDTVPGLTGLWQVNGKNRLSFHEMIRLDIQYSRTVSFIRDIWIAIKTPLAICQQLWDAFALNPRPLENALQKGN